MTDSEFTLRCEYCGTAINADGEERSDVPACGPRMTHYSYVCRDRVHSDLRRKKLELAAANARAADRVEAMDELLGRCVHEVMRLTRDERSACDRANRLATRCQDLERQLAEVREILGADPYETAADAARRLVRRTTRVPLQRPE